MAEFKVKVDQDLLDKFQQVADGLKAVGNALESLANSLRSRKTVSVLPNEWPVTIRERFEE